MSTAGTCNHCFCQYTTAGRLVCHRCGQDADYFAPPQDVCPTCGGTGRVQQARTPYNIYIEENDEVI